MKILFIEPHPDDILLSMYHFIKKESFGKNNYLLTVTNPKRESSELFCKKMGLNYLPPLGIENLDWKLRVKPSKATWDNLYGSYISLFVEDSKFYNQLTDIVFKYKIDTIVSPIGLLHPMHFFTRYISDITDIDKYYYADIPYQYRRYGQRLISTSGKRIYRAYIPSEDEVKEKIDVFLEYYKSQRNIILNSWNESKNLIKGESIYK